MRIGVDAREIENGVITGIGRSLANFIQYFSRHEKEHQLVLFSTKPIPTDPGRQIMSVTIGPCATFLWDQVQLARAIKRNSIDLFYSPYYKMPLLTKIPVVSQILDLMFLVFPPYVKSIGAFGRLYYAIFGRAFARKSVGIITDSDHAKGDIVRLWGIQPEKITVIPLGVGKRYRPVSDPAVLAEVRKKNNLPEKYILYLGNFKPHKNVETLVKAFKIIEKNHIPYMLVLAGPLDENGRRIRALVADQGLSDRVMFTGTIRESDCPEAILTMADVFVFPTLYEGFGLPPLEAMACGTPVISSNRTAVPEVVQDAGIMVDPLDAEQLGRAIADLLDHVEKRKVCARKGLERARLFQEENTAGKIHQYLLCRLEDFR